MSESTVRVLVLADTHLTAATLDRMPEEVWDRAAEADAILHAGDVIEQVVLDELSRRAPVHAVLGNNDRTLVGALADEVELDLGGLRVAMVHDSGPTKGRERRMVRRFPDADVVIFGHSHQPVLHQCEPGPLLVNPGSPTHRRRQPVHTVAWLEIGEGAIRSAAIIEVGPLAR